MYSKGSYFGDSDVISDLPRDGTAKVDAESNLLVMDKKDVTEIMKMYKHTIAKDMIKIANERRMHHDAAI